MKIVLKRRKHRKGIRPKRKGTLKVRMVTLPTRDEHVKRIDELMDIILQSTRTRIYKLLRPDMTYSELWAYKRYNAMADVIHKQIGQMQKGYQYFREHKQIQFAELAGPAVSEYDPLYSKIETPCDTCSVKSGLGYCPFSAWNGVAKLADLCSRLRDAPKPQVKTTAEMANLALTHLS